MMRAAGSPRELLRAHLQGFLRDRPPVLVHLAAYAARLQQLSYQEMSSNPTLLANSIQSAQRLFGCDALILVADSTLEAEACGCEVGWREDQPVVTSHPFAGESPVPLVFPMEGLETRGRLAVALEAARRLRAVMPPGVALLPTVTGPVTLAGHLCGPRFMQDLTEARGSAGSALQLAGRVTIHVAKQYLEMGFEYLLVADPLLGEVDPAHQARVAACLRPLWNVADFFDALVLLQTAVTDPLALERLCSLGAAGLLVEGDIPPGEFGEAVGGPGGCLVVALPAALLTGAVEDVRQEVSAWRAGCEPRSFFACCQVPASSAPENVHEALRVLKS